MCTCEWEIMFVYNVVEIVDLVDDMHSSIKQIIEHFNIRNAYSSTDSITLIAEKLCFIVKQTVRDTAVGKLPNVSITIGLNKDIKYLFNNCRISITKLSIWVLFNRVYFFYKSAKFEDKFLKLLAMF